MSKGLTHSQSRWLAIAQAITKRDKSQGQWVRLWMLGGSGEREPVALIRLGLVEKKADEHGYWFRLTNAGVDADTGWHFNIHTGYWEPRQ